MWIVKHLAAFVAGTAAKELDPCCPATVAAVRQKLGPQLPLLKDSETGSLLEGQPFTFHLLLGCLAAGTAPKWTLKSNLKVDFEVHFETPILCKGVLGYQPYSAHCSGAASAGCKPPRPSQVFALLWLTVTVIPF